MPPDICVELAADGAVIAPPSAQAQATGFHLETLAGAEADSGLSIAPPSAQAQATGFHLETLAGAEADSGLSIGWLVVLDCTNGESPPELQAALLAAGAARVADAESSWAVARKAAVRDLLRHGTYKPTGRAKPASEYLARTASEGDIPFINVLADANNVVSLETLFPISIIDLDRASADRYVVRWGRESEKYVFNPSGQELELRDLLLTARLPSDRPCASPVKDSQETKTDASTRRALGIVYGPATLRSAVHEATARLADLLTRHAGATVTWGVL